MSPGSPGGSGEPRAAARARSRLLYGIVAPLGAAIVLIALWGWTGAEWLLPAVVFAIVVPTLIVIVGMYQALSEDPEPGDDEAGGPLDGGERAGPVVKAGAGEPGASP